MGKGQLIVKNLVKQFGDFTAIDSLDLVVHPGELLSVVGPSGSGKTTLLRIIAGLLEPDKGEVSLDEISLSGLSPKDREIAMVFQDGALYPHLTVRQNLAFPLKARKRSGERAVPKMAKRLGIENLLDRYPKEISGGEAGRVALGRALIRKPKLFLLDEPLVGLDIPLRDKLRELIRDLVYETKVTTICVTHDQSDAMAIGQRVAVVKEGNVVQVDTPKDIYEKPNCEFIARFFGTPPMNLLPGKTGAGMVKGPWGFFIALNAYESRDVICGVRCQDISFSDSKEGISGVVKRVDYFGHEIIVAISLSDGFEVKALFTDKDESPEPGQKVRLAVSPDAIHFFHEKTGERL